MATLFVRHNVADYAAWRKVYDSVASMQKAGGVTAEAVYRSADDPNDVTVTHEFASIEAAKAFAGREDLKAAMQRAGVVGAPTIWFTNKT
jgi:quinol monooxygenase YgiN